MEAGAIAGTRVGLGDECAGGVVAVVGGECGGVAGEESRTGVAIRAVGAGGAGEPYQITARICNEKEALGWGAEAEIDEVLAGAGGCAGNDGGFDVVAASVEEGEAVGVVGEGL